MTFRPVTIEDGRVVEHRPESAHPEDTCQRCGGPNVVWFAPNDVWNRVMPDDGGILCPTCFVQLATSAGLDSIWCLAPSVHPVISLESRLATAETALADRDRHFLWDERLRMEREIGDLATRLATAEAERNEARRLVNEAHNARLHAQGAAGFCICAVCEAYRDSGVSRGAPSTRGTPS